MTHLVGEEPIAESSDIQSHVREIPAPNDRALAGLRIAVGLLFLLFGEYKVFGREFVFGGGFQGWIQRFLAEGSAYPFISRLAMTLSMPANFLLLLWALAVGGFLWRLSTERMDRDAAV